MFSLPSVLSLPCSASLFLSVRVILPPLPPFSQLTTPTRPHSTMSGTAERPTTLDFITGNANKLAEVRAILGDVVDLQSRDIPGLDEIQGTIEEIAMDKCRRAAQRVGTAFSLGEFCVQAMRRANHTEVPIEAGTTWSALGSELSCSGVDASLRLGA